MGAQDGYILGIDLGTSSVKLALVQTDGLVVASDTEPVSLLLTPDGGVEQDPGEWWEKIALGCRRLLSRSGQAQRVIGIGCTAQWSTTVAIDEDGRPLGNAVLWMDTRGAPDIRALTGGLVSIEGYAAFKLWRWIRLTGGAPAHSGKDPLAHILFLRRARPDIYRQARYFLEPKDFLNFRLTGRVAASYDSIALYWLTDNRNPAAVHYDPGLLHLAGLTADRLPRLQRSVDVLGPVLPGAAEALGVPPGIPVVTGSPDVPAAAVGSGATDDYAAHLYVGTSSWITCHVPFKKTDLLHNMASLPSAIPGRYLVANEQETAGACLNFLADALLFPADCTGARPPNTHAILNDLAAGVPAGSHGVFFTPWLVGERTPVEDAYLRAGFHNLSLGTTRADLVRAVFEGVALNSRWLLEAEEHFLGRRLDRLTFIGGGARSPLWCQIFADVLNRSVQPLADPVSANVRGAAVLASVGLGLTSFEAAHATALGGPVYEPRPQVVPLYQKLFQEYTGFYRRNRRAFHRLNRQMSAPVPPPGPGFSACP
ncbi:MAG TPA: FGGY-family carbohydrate kinase [Spirochaetia bacterium]|nr:FGGY-family carbohydrate kinase [Spirochaetia bacterium]